VWLTAERANTALSGAARTDQLLRARDRAAIREAVDGGAIVRLARGRYALVGLEQAVREATRLNGTIVGPSAALQHGWEIARSPVHPWIAVPRNRKVSLAQRKGVQLLYSNRYTDARSTVSSPLDTVTECSRRLPYDEALAVADSALRSGTVEGDELRHAAAGVRGKGAAQCRRVAADATPLAANPFESVLRAVANGIPGLDARPQVTLELAGREVTPDLYDEALGLVIEADSWLFHASTPESFTNDIWRYTTMVADGLVVARFGHQHVMHEQDWVTDCLTSIVRTCKQHARYRPAA
jgi:hypothetical protein